MHLYQGVPTAGRMLAYITQLKMSKLPTSLALSSHTQQSRTAQKLSLWKDPVKKFGYMPKGDRFLSRRYSSNFVFHPWGDMPAREHQLPPNTIPLSQLWSPFKILSRTAGCIGCVHPSKSPDGQRWRWWTIARIQVDHAFSSINTLGSISYMSSLVSRVMKVQYFYRGTAGQDQCCAIGVFPCSWFPAATADVTNTGTALGCLLFLFCSLKK